MRKLVLHLAVASITFVASALVTNVLSSLRRVDVTSETFAPSSFGSEPITATGEQNLHDIYRDYAAAQTRHDREFFERVESDSFILYADGQTFSRTEDIELMNSYPTDVVYEMDDIKIESHGNAAVVTGRMTAIESDGSRQSWRWIDVCVKRNERWLILSTTQLD